jgi:hypothetical protein
MALIGKAQRSRHVRRLFAARQHASGIGQPQLNKPGMGRDEIRA